MAHRILTSLVGIDATFSSTLSLTSLAGVGNRMLIVNSAGTVSTQAIPVGTVTSVGLSMPSAFSVASSPVTGSGTLTVTGAGTTAQYIDGTGALQTFPTTLPSTNVQHQVKAGVAINKGQAVYVTSADGTNMIVGLASNTSEATSSKTMGLLDATVAINGFANVITEGLLAGLDTSTAGAAGDPVWLGTNGNLIYGLANKPYAPAHLVFIGIVTRKNLNNGEIFVKVQNGFELKEIHDVDLITTTPINGHLLGFDGTLWVNKTIAGWLGYTPLSGTGTTNYVPKWTGSTALGNSLIYDNGTNVGIGTTSPSQKLHVSGGFRLDAANGEYFRIDSATSDLRWSRNTGTSEASQISGYGNSMTYSTRGNHIFVTDGSNHLFLSDNTGTQASYWNTTLGINLGNTTSLTKNATVSIKSSNTTSSYSAFSIYNSANTELLRVWDDGTIGIGVAGTNAGFKLDVNGTLRAQGKLTVTTGGAEITGTAVLYSGAQSYGQVQIFSAAAFQMFNAANNSKASFQYINANGLLLTTNSDNISGVLKGLQVNPTMVAAANNDILVGLDITPTFTNGAFTGVSNWGIRSQAPVFINPTISTTNSLLRLTDNVNGTAWMGFSTVVATGFFIGANGSVTLGQGVSGDNSAPTGAFVNLRSSSGSRITLNTNSAAEGIVFSDNNNATIRMQFPSANEAAITTITSHNLSIGTSAGAAGAVTNTLKFFQSTGNVFIGSSPTDSGYKLDVAGTIRSSSTVYGVNVANTNGNPVIGSDGSNIYLGSNQLYRIVFTGNAIKIQPSNGTSSVVAGVFDGTSALYVGGNATADASAILETASTTRGFLQPRMTTTQRNAIATPATGLSIYNTTTNTEDYYNGTAWVSLQTSITNPVTGTGTTNYLPKWTSSSVIGNSLVYDDGTNVGIGTTTFLGKFQVGSGSATQFQVASSGASIYVGPSSGNYNMNITTNTIQSSNSGNTNTYLYIQPNGTGNVAMCSSGTNKVLIGTTTDAGYKLDVNGTTRIAGVATFNNNITQTSGSATFANGIILDSTRRIFGGNTITYQSNDAASQHYFKNDISSGLSGTLVTIGNGSGAFGTTSASNFLNISGRLATASGTNNLTSILLNHTVENTGTYTGTIRGIYYNPSSIIGTGFTHRAIETTTGDVLFGTTSGVVGIGTTTLSTEANLYLGAKSTSEGGQLILQKGTAQTYATHLDNYNNLFRVLYGTDTGSSGVAMTVNMSTGQVSLPFYTTTSSFTGTAVGYIAFDSGGNLLTVAAPGGAVTSVSGGTGVTVSPTTGNVVVSIGQSVATSATPSFDQVFTTNNGNGTNLKIGDDAWIGDVNTANTFGIRGQQNAANGYISFGSTDISTGLGRAGSGPLTWGGYTIYHSNNSNTITALGTITTGVWNGTAITDTYISSASTWNAKQNALTLTTTGTSGAATLVGATLNIPQYQSVLTNPVTGTGTTNYISKFTGTSTIGNSLLFDDGTNVGISTTSPSYKLDVNGTFRVQGNSSIIATSLGVSSSANAYVYDSTTNYLVLTKRGSSEIGNMGLPAGSVEIGNYNNGALGIWTSSNYIALGSNGSEKMRLNISTGNVLINTTTDSGYKLDVNGTARINSTLTVTNSAYTGGGSFYQSANSTTVIAGGPASENITFGPSNRIFINAQQTRIPGGSLQIASTLTAGSLTATATSMIWANGSITASSVARGIYTDTTLTASANNDVLVGVDIAPTFTNGVYTGVSNIGLRVRDNNSGFDQIVTTRTLVTIGNTSNQSINAVNTQILTLPKSSGGGLLVQSNNASTFGLTESPCINFNNVNGQTFARLNAVGTNGNLGRLEIGVAQPSTSISSGAFFYAAANRGTTQFALGSDFTDNSRAVIVSHWDGASALILKPNASTTTAPTLRVRNNADSGDNFLVYGTTGNVGINVSSDAGYKLDVNGTSRIVGNLTVGATGTNGVINLARSSDGGTTGAIVQTSGITQVLNYQGSGIDFYVAGASTVVRAFVRTTGIGITGTGGGSFTMDASAALQMNTTTQGFLPPRMTATQRGAISTPAVGLVVYQTDGVEGLYVNTSGGWKALTMT